MKKIKSWIIGASVATINIIPAATQVIKPERCTGSCGSCGFSCVGSIAGIAVLGVVGLTTSKIRYIYIKKKIKGK